MTPVLSTTNYPRRGPAPENASWPTDGTAALVPTMGPDREALFVVLVKRSYKIRHNHVPTPLDVTRPLELIDRYYDDGDPQVVPVRVESETTAYKIETDFVVVASAWAPQLRPVRQLDAMVEVGAVKKTIRVIGDRTCEHRSGRSPRFTDPVPFVDVPIRYDRAYGGVDETSLPEKAFLYPRNPRGTGFVLGNQAEKINGLPLPNVEDPTDLLTPDRIIMGDPIRWSEYPLPQGFGWFPKFAYPRCGFVGAIPAYVAPGMPLKEEALGLVPKNQVALAKQFRLPSYDVRFNRGASIGLAMPFLSGGEPVRLTNLSPEGTLAFPLPRERPKLGLDIGQGMKELPVVLHTAQVRAEEWQLDLIWRGALQYPGIEWLPKMTRLVGEVTWP